MTSNKKQGCRKCGAGRSALDLSVQHRSDGAVYQVVRCLLCGEQVERERPAPAYRNARRPVDHQNMSHVAPVQTKTQTCTYPGCLETYSTNKSHTLLCKFHRLPLHRWTANKARCPSSTLAPPLTRVNGHWVDRGAPLPGIPGEQPPATAAAPAVIPPAAVPKKTARVSKNARWVEKCDGCKTRRVIIAWGLCLDCLDAQKQKGKQK
jgi:hypothetical protein